MHKQLFKRLWHGDIGRHWEQTLGTVARGKGGRNWESSTETYTFSLVQFSRSVVYNCLGPHELQHARPPRPLPTTRAYSNACPLSQWCHPKISSSVAPFSSCLQCFPASGSFHMSQFFTSGGQSIGTSVSASVLPTNIQGWFLLGLTGLISLLQHHNSETSTFWKPSFWL